MFKNKMIILLLLTLLFIGCSSHNLDPQSELELSNLTTESVYSTQTEEPVNTSLNSEEPKIHLERHVNLNSWIGEYVYIDGPSQELVDSIIDSPVSPKYIIYELYIHKCSVLDLYYAELSVYGWMTSFNAFAYIQGDDEEISAIFFEQIPGEIPYDSLKRGDVLLKLKKTEEGILTYWGEIFKYNSDENATFIKIDNT